MLGLASERCQVFLVEEKLGNSATSASGRCCDAEKVAATLFPARGKSSPWQTGQVLEDGRDTECGRQEVV